MRIMALDLSLTATGVVVVERMDEEEALCRVLSRATIKPPDRRKNETTGAWNARRYRRFHQSLADIILGEEPDVLVTEVTEHAYQVAGKGKKSTKGIEFRAGYGLGRAIGWLDAVCALNFDGTYEQISATEVKRRVAGGTAADKAAVKDGLKTYFHIDVDDWPDSESDALAVAVAWLRNLKHDERMVEIQSGPTTTVTQVLQQIDTGIGVVQRARRVVNYPMQ